MGDKIYRLRVELKGLKKTVWRTIEVPGTYTFWELNCAIQDSFGWSNTALHEFVMEDGVDGIYIIALPDDELVYEALHSRQEFISNHLPAEGKHFEYMYDFDSGWEHDITVLSAEEADKGESYPRCVEGEGACPPESTEGAWEYEHALEVIANNVEDEYEDALATLGSKDFNPDHFILEDVVFNAPEESWKNRF